MSSLFLSSIVGARAQRGFIRTLLAGSFVTVLGLSHVHGDASPSPSLVPVYEVTITDPADKVYSGANATMGADITAAKPTPPTVTENSIVQITVPPVDSYFDVKTLMSTTLNTPPVTQVGSGALMECNGDSTGCVYVQATGSYIYTYVYNVTLPVDFTVYAEVTGTSGLPVPIIVTFQARP